jgi:hypothetical protein
LVDRVYKAGIPEMRKSLEKLKVEFSKLKSKTNWTKVRIDPLLRHARQLERQLKAQSSARLTKGVGMFHSDLVYLRDNVTGLKRVLLTETRALKGRIRRRGKRVG